MRMSYSRTNFSMRGSVVGAGSPATITLNARALGVLELGANVVVIVLGKRDRAGSVELDAGGSVVGQCLRFQRGIHRQMVLHVLAVQVGKVQLLHEADQLRRA